MFFNYDASPYGKLGIYGMQLGLPQKRRENRKYWPNLENSIVLVFGAFIHLWKN